MGFNFKKTSEKRQITIEIPEHMDKCDAATLLGIIDRGIQGSEMVDSVKRYGPIFARYEVDGDVFITQINNP